MDIIQNQRTSTIVIWFLYVSSKIL